MDNKVCLFNIIKFFYLFLLFWNACEKNIFKLLLNKSINWKLLIICFLKLLIYFD